MISLNTMILGLYAQAATSAAPAPAEQSPSAEDLSAARAAAEAAAREAAGQGQSLSLMDLWAKLETVEKSVMVLLGLCAVYSIALLFEKVWVMNRNGGLIKNFLAQFRKANSVEEAEQIV